MNFKITRIVIPLIAIFMTMAFLVSGCTQAPMPTRSTPSSVSQPAPSRSTPPPSSQPPASQITAEPAPAPSAMRTPLTSGESAPTDVYSKLNISKPPAVGETVDLTYVMKRIGFLRKSINKVWLEFERYDPALYYPLGKGQFYKDQSLKWLSKASPDSGFYFVTSRAANDQPDSIVPAKSVVVSGNTTWEGTLLESGTQVNFTAQVNFPKEGEWVISAISQDQDAKSYIDSSLFLTVNKDSGTFGWPDDYSEGTGYVDANPVAPVGIYLKTTRAPLVNEEMPLNITIYSIEDLYQATASLVFTRMDGYKTVGVASSEVIAEGEGKWEGSLKKGVPAQFSCVVKFPSEGDWAIGFQTRASPDSLERTMQSLPIHVDKQNSLFIWPVDHHNPAFDKPTQEQIEKANRDNPKTLGPTSPTHTGTPESNN